MDIQWPAQSIQWAEAHPHSNPAPRDARTDSLDAATEHTPGPANTRAQHSTGQRSNMSLECYWKLVSADAEERTLAAHDLVASLREDAAKELPANLDYAVKRLVRGLSSSTEAARQVSRWMHQAPSGIPSHRSHHACDDCIVLAFSSPPGLHRILTTTKQPKTQGFASCLAELIAGVPQIPLKVVWDHMVASTEVGVVPGGGGGGRRPRVLCCMYVRMYGVQSLRVDFSSHTFLSARTTRCAT